MLVDPGMIRRHVVRDEVEHQLQAALLQPLAQAGRAPHRRPDRDARCSSGWRTRSRRCPRRCRSGSVSSNSRRHSGFAARDRLRRRAGLPDAQEPDPVETQLGQAIQSASGMSSSVARRPSVARQFRQPDAGVDLVKRRIARIGHVRSSARSRLFSAHLLPDDPGHHAARVRSPAGSLASTRPKRSRRGATRPVHPVWWLAPRPAPLSPWKYS